MIEAIIALDQNDGMGKEGTLPWPHNKEDLIRFRSLTAGRTVMMGKNTWVDPKFPKPLPERRTIVVTAYPGTLSIMPDVVVGFDEANDMCKHDNKIILIGGAMLLKSLAHHIHLMYITRMPKSYFCDVKLSGGYRDLFDLVGEEKKDDLVFETWKRVVY